MRHWVLRKSSCPSFWYQLGLLTTSATETTHSSLSPKGDFIVRVREMSVSQEQTRTKKPSATAQCCFVPLPVLASIFPLTAEGCSAPRSIYGVQKMASSGSLVYRPPGEGLISFLSVPVPIPGESFGWAETRWLPL